MRGFGLGGSNREISGHGVQMSELCEMIENFEHVVVVDETNLERSYSFHVKGNGDFKRHAPRAARISAEKRSA
jgi:hypothetical protein